MSEWFPCKKHNKQNQLFHNITGWFCMDCTVELRAENKRLNEIVGSLNVGDTDAMNAVLKAFQIQRKELESEIWKLRQDIEDMEFEAKEEYPE